MSSRVIRSSTLISSASSSRISVRRPSPCFSAMAFVSSFTTPRIFVSLASRAFRLSISARVSASSSTIFRTSRFVRRCSCMSRMAWAWRSERPKVFIRPARARLDVLRGLDERDHRVDVVERDLQALEDVRALLGLREVELRAADDHLAPVGHEAVDHLAQRQRLRHAAHEGEVVDAERHLQLRVGEELVQDHLRRDALPEVDHDAHAVPVALVVQVGDPVDLPFLHEVGDAHDERALVDLVGDLGDDDRVLALARGLDRHLRANDDLAPARGERFADAPAAEDEAAGGEVGAAHDLHQLVEGGLGPLDHLHDGVRDLVEVVRRDVGGHADRDAARAVAEQERECPGQHQRLFLRAVVVGAEVDGVLVDVPQHLLGDLAETALGVPDRRGGVAVDAAEVALPVHHGVAQREVLREAHERVVDRHVAVGVVLAQHVADHPSALLVGLVRVQAHLLHGEEDAPVHGLQAVAHVGQRARDDDRHGVVEVGGLHLLLDGDLDGPGAHVRHRGWSPRGHCPR